MTKDEALIQRLREEATHELNHETIALLLEAAEALAQPAPMQHPDDEAVDRFAVAMKEKLDIARKKGRGGWEECPPEDLSRMLREHLEKGDPRDVSNFCMMLWNLGAGITATPPAAQPEQEPVAQYIGECSEGSLVQLYDDVKKGTNFYTTPPTAQQEPAGIVYSVPVGQVIGPDGTSKFAHTVLANDRLLLNQSVYTTLPAAQRKPLTSKDFEEFVKAELGDTAVSDNGRYISPKIQNYWKIWEHCNTTPPAAQRKSLTDVIKAAQGVLEWIEIAHQPPLRDRLEVGRTARVRIHALADLKDALAAHGITKGQP